MKSHYLIHNLNHTTLLVDITAIGLPDEIFPPEGKSQTVTSLRFQGWASAERYLSDQGAGEQELRKLRESLSKVGVGVLTIT
jgi:hypothetical protein